MENTDAPPASTPDQKSSNKARSFSDPLAPSPSFRERSHSRDDHALPPSTPRAQHHPRRPELLSRGLTLQLPDPKVTETAMPLSPKQTEPHSFIQTPGLLPHSPATSLPRHSRGLDFSRASTNLHHSTLPEFNSPCSSPVITQKALPIPGRKLSMSNMVLDGSACNGTSNMPWNTGAYERGTMGSSIGSANMLNSESESSNSDEDASMGGDDFEDPMFATPQVHKLQNPHTAPTPFHTQSTPGGTANTTWGSGSHFSPAQASLMKTIRRTRLHKTGRRSRKSSSSASGSGYNSMASQRNTSPPPIRSIESAGNFPWSSAAARSRRESLAMGTDALHLSSGNDSGDEATLPTPSTPGVVRRAVTRRQNLLPKTKGFARIRAALMEEAAPVDSEVRREAETIRQVRERDGSAGELDLERPQSSTAQSSPNLLPAVPESAQEDFGRELDDITPSQKSIGMGANFSAHASRNSGGLDYWNRFDPSMRTPPPNATPAASRQSSVVMSDAILDSPMGDFTQWRRPRARSSASDASDAFGPSSGMPAGVSDDMHLKKFKRRREDDFDIATIKRRAVSPGLSAQNSPVLTSNSPSQRDTGGLWGLPPDRRSRGDTPTLSSDPSMSGSQSQPQPLRGNGSTSLASGSSGNLASQGKKLGLQPMADTNDGLMKMSIE